MVGIDEMKLASKLLVACRSFIREHQISCADDIFQSDSIIIGSPELVGKVCSIVGYFNHDTGEIEPSEEE